MKVRKYKLTFSDGTEQIIEGSCLHEALNNSNLHAVILLTCLWEEIN